MTTWPSSKGSGSNSTFNKAYSKRTAIGRMMNNDDVKVFSLAESFYSLIIWRLYGGLYERLRYFPPAP
jgi:hypothetical protein